MRLSGKFSFTLLFSLFCLFGLSSNVHSQGVDDALKKRVSEMKDKGQFCEKEGRILEFNLHHKVTSDCRHFCSDGDEVLGKIAQAKIPPGQINESLKSAADRCDSAYTKVVELVKEKRASMSGSISDKYGLKNQDYRAIIDKAHDSCINKYHNLHKAECDCIAKFVVGHINRSGNMSRIETTFMRSVPECRGL